MPMKLRAMPAGPLETNAYMLSDTDSGQAILVDAPVELWDQAEPVLKEDGCKLVGLLLTHGKLVGLLLTHGHYDHIGDAAKIHAMGVPTWGHLDDKPMYENPEMMRSYAYPPDTPLDPVEIDHWVGEGDSFELMGLNFEVRHVPGHCPGNILFYAAQVGVALVGDALFAGSIGRTDLPGGSFDVLEKSIRERIYTLPDETRVLPGHGPTTTVGEEKMTNPFVSV